MINGTPIGPGFFIFFQDRPNATDEGKAKKPYDQYDYEGYEKVKEHVTKPLYKQTIEVVESIVKTRAEGMPKKSMAEVLGLEYHEGIEKAYIDHEIIETYKRMRANKSFLMIILACVVDDYVSIEIH